jgi:UDP-N-acetylglucosamine--N-acetylmuramyl-(pentapeptide) pyrophosphoryl-undecaprenol N-acetylglucosamine transferase
MKIIISGGGTGGHIYPAIAIANEIKHLKPEAEILFVGALGKMEMEKVPKAGYRIEGLWISGIQRKLSLDNLSFPFKVFASCLKARRILRQFKPDIVIGVGGYASGPLLYMANRAKIPTLIQEQNAFAGLTNKWLAKKVRTICVAYTGMERFFPKEKLVLTGNPVRRDILDIASKKEAAPAHFGLLSDKKTLLVLGGSLGARSINESISANLAKILEKGIQLIWQTGKNTYQVHTEEAKYLQNKSIYKTDFIYPMDLAYAAADVVISRAGALAVSELCIAGKPTVFVPFPHAAEDHQTQNALALVKQNAGLLVKDNEAQSTLIDTTLRLLQNQAQCASLSRNIRTLATPEATAQIAAEILKLVRST